MDMHLIYVLKGLLLPPTSLLLLALVGLAINSKHRSLSIKLMSIAIGLLLLLSLPLVANYLMGTQEQYQALEEAEVLASNAQIVVVLGGGSRANAYEYENSVTVQTGVLERLRYTARVARLTELPILVSGGNVLDQNLPSEASLMAEVMRVDFHTTVDFLEHKSRNTAENAQYSFALLAPLGIDRIILVTHAIHMRRAVERFKWAGFDVLPAPTYFMANTEPLKLLDFIPSAEALQNNHMILHELLGRYWYRLRYG